jgi:hypothetical protein
MLGGLANSITGSALHHDQANANVVLVSALEKLQRDPYQRCASQYLITGVTVPSDWFGKPWKIDTQIWYPNATTYAPMACNDSDASGNLFPSQLVIVTVWNPAHTVSRTGRVVKRGDLP